MILNRLRSVIWMFTTALAVLEPVGISALLAGDMVDEQAHRKVELSDLPAPPDRFRELIERGNVTFLVGGERPSTVDPHRRSTEKEGRFDAATSYHAHYSFKSLCRWGWAETSRAKRLAFAIRYRELDLFVEHQVWLRKMPQLDRFWNSPLVCHEMDHVRLSSDPQLNLRFVSAVKQRKRIELTRAESAPVLEAATQLFTKNRGRFPSILNFLDADDAEPWVKANLDKEFEQTLQLIEIRYQELDRQTDHGKRPVPREGELSEWLAAEPGKEL